MSKSLEMISRNVRRLREKRKWSRERLAEAAKVHLNSVERLENGKGKPSWHTIESLAEALGVNPFSLGAGPKGG
jgi:transcriptional regulator with XRE-family HTH domain